MNKFVWAIITIIVIAGLSISSINNIPKSEAEVEASASQLLNQYKRRSELVPQLVEVVKGAANYEKTTLENVIKERAKVGTIKISAQDLKNNPNLTKQFFNAQTNMGSALTKLLAVSERYPELKVTQNFSTLQSQIEGNENRISVARRDYINSVRNFNILITTFPGFMWNKIFFSHEKLANYTESDSIKETPKIAFN
ncbi:LemA family protein [Rickettsiales endosymbiont of Trichoplax sp. H2]|uniref:LemA family protein n=1 Tax=Rickettsiales endosymbiont of Trichoplax sp. H2 TaxID=2021221 RepID=UPI0012B4113A|nr:LemA family protein [Rickettsiales endosymbiont of Trichoplax sp. H2]MSO13401.1 Protein LemA [Rickettsiales endosymbiont of Trichoplax sp. H2]